MATLWAQRVSNFQNDRHARWYIVLHPKQKSLESWIGWMLSVEEFETMFPGVKIPTKPVQVEVSVSMMRESVGVD